MAYRRKGRKFGRERSQRKAFLRSLAVGLVTHGKIRTTEIRAKELRKIIERALTRGKKQNLAAYRNLLRFFPKSAARKIFYEICLRHKERSGGYTRITKLGPRSSDGARMAIIEFVE